MNRDQVKEMAKVHAEYANSFSSVDMGCKGCMHFFRLSQSADRCTHWQDTVPIEHQAAGCDAWEYDEIPF